MYGLKDKQLAKILPLVMGVPQDAFARDAVESGDVSVTASKWYGRGETQASRAAAAVDAGESAAGRPGKRARCDSSGGTSGGTRDAGACGSDGIEREVAQPPRRAARTGGLQPAAQPSLTLRDVDAFLDGLTALTRDAEYQHALAAVVPRCTPLELKWLLRLILHDLRIGAQAAQLLTALGGEDAWDDYRYGADLATVVARYTGDSRSSAERRAQRRRAASTREAEDVKGDEDYGEEDDVGERHEPDYVDNEELEDDSSLPAAEVARRNRALDVRPGVPIKPMLAAPVTSTAAAREKCTGTIIAEIKYDGASCCRTAALPCSRVDGPQLHVSLTTPPAHLRSRALQATECKCTRTDRHSRFSRER